MATLLVETGSGVSGANSYVSRSEADDYFESHPFYADTWEDLGEIDKDNLLMAASRMIDSIMLWYGTSYSTSQGLAWPMVTFVNNYGQTITANTIPQGLKTAVYELAVFLAKGDPFAPASSTGVDRLKIDVIELEFSKTQNGGSRSTAPVPAAALLALRGLGYYTLGSRVQKVMVG